MKLKYDIRITYYNKDIIKSFSYINGGEENGEHKEYFENGNVGIKCEFKNNNFISDLIIFNTNGIELSRYTYK